MTPGKYIAEDGSTRDFDLEAVISFLESDSSRREGWASLIVYHPSKDIFLELRDSPPDIRGNSQSECEEISPAEVATHYGISETTCMQIRKNPRAWRLIDQRQGA